ncbi:MAG: hypothetical protein U0452_06525 [Anaerolineae bacterium]
MMMRKILLVPCILLLVGLSACGGQSAPTATPVPPTVAQPAATDCTITINVGKPVYSQPLIDSAIIGETLINTPYVVNGVWQQGENSTRWYPIAGFPSQGYVNVAPNEYYLSPNCPG